MTGPSIGDALQAGLLLEVSGVILPWGASRSAIETLARPTSVSLQSGFAILSYHGERFLGGVAHPLQITFRPYEPDAFVEAHAELAAPFFDDVRDALARALGAPSTEAPELVEHRVGRVTVVAHVWERFGERCSLTIRVDH